MTAPLDERGDMPDADVLRGLGWRGPHECKVMPDAPRCDEPCGCYSSKNSAEEDEDGDA